MEWGRKYYRNKHCLHPQDLAPAEKLFVEGLGLNADGKCSLGDKAFSDADVREDRYRNGRFLPLRTLLYFIEHIFPQLGIDQPEGCVKWARKYHCNKYVLPHDDAALAEKLVVEVLGLHSDGECPSNAEVDYFDHTHSIIRYFNDIFQGWFADEDGSAVDFHGKGTPHDEGLVTPSSAETSLHNNSHISGAEIRLFLQLSKMMRTCEILSKMGCSPEDEPSVWLQKCQQKKLQADSDAEHGPHDDSHDLLKELFSALGLDKGPGGRGNVQEIENFVFMWKLLGRFEFGKEKAVEKHSPGDFKKDMALFFAECHDKEGGEVRQRVTKDAEVRDGSKDGGDRRDTDCLGLDRLRERDLPRNRPSHSADGKGVVGGKDDKGGKGQKRHRSLAIDSKAGGGGVASKRRLIESPEIGTSRHISVAEEGVDKRDKSEVRGKGGRSGVSQNSTQQHGLEGVGDLSGLLEEGGDLNEMIKLLVYQRMLEYGRASGELDLGSENPDPKPQHWRQR
ncbi:hypothetical protein HK102_004558 [Quaeritorhiza haematococci]|nr:hypothetical protein HK102_004558 [Quaeritorhiza haematococci]